MWWLIGMYVIYIRIIRLVHLVKRVHYSRWQEKEGGETTCLEFNTTNVAFGYLLDRQPNTLVFLPFLIRSKRKKKDKKNPRTWCTLDMVQLILGYCLEIWFIGTGLSSSLWISDSSRKLTAKYGPWGFLTHVSMFKCMNYVLLSLTISRLLTSQACFRGKCVCPNLAPWSVPYGESVGFLGNWRNGWGKHK